MLLVRKGEKGRATEDNDILGIKSYHSLVYYTIGLDYTVYITNDELANKGAFTSVVVLTASFPYGFCRGRDLNPRLYPEHLTPFIFYP